MKTPIWILVLAFSFFVVNLVQAGGWGSSGGGSGVACFANQALAIQAKSFVQAAKPLPADLKKKIKSLDTLDYWEWSQKKDYELLDFKSNTADGIINEMQSHMQFYAPLFLYRLQQTTQIIKPTDWNKKEFVPRIEDAKPRHPLPDKGNCLLVQLAGRYTEQAYEKRGQGPTLYSPTVEIDVDQDLFKMLTPLNQAILIVHEQMYLLLQSLGINSSDQIRPFVVYFFAKEIHSHYQLRLRLVQTFGDYVMFFGEAFKAQGPYGSQESRFNSFYKILRDIRSNAGSCHRQKSLAYPIKTDQDRRTHKECADRAMDFRLMQEKLNEEESFLFLVYFAIGFMVEDFNSEILIAPIQDEEYKKFSHHTLQESCAFLIFEGDKFAAKKMVAKAQAYCTSLFPKERDQN